MTNPEANNEFIFLFEGNTRRHIVTFVTDGEHFHSACTCSSENLALLCWHRRYILAGRSAKLKKTDDEKHARLLSATERSSVGKEMLHISRTYYAKKGYCHECRENALKPLLPLLMVIFGFFGRQHSKYFCSSCKRTPEKMTS